MSVPPAVSASSSRRLPFVFRLLGPRGPTKNKKETSMKRLEPPEHSFLDQAVIMSYQDRLYGRPFEPFRPSILKMNYPPGLLKKSVKKIAPAHRPANRSISSSRPSAEIG